MKQRLKQCVRALLGDVAWTPPDWCRQSQQRLRTIPAPMRQYLLRGFLLLVVLVPLGFAARYWWLHRPHPQFATVSLVAPPITPNTDELKPSPLKIIFSESAAPLDAVGKNVTAGITLEPAVAGAWRWQDDKTLLFAPTNDWRADTSYDLTFANNYFPKQLHLEKLRYAFATPIFTAEISTFDFYQNPRDAKDKQMVATVRFSHPVDPKIFESHLQMRTEASTTAHLPEVPHLLTVQYDPHHREAYVHSNVVTPGAQDRFVLLTIADGVQTDAAYGGAVLKKSTTHQATLPGIATFFQITSVEALIVDDPHGEPEQVLMIRTKDGVRAKDLQALLTVVALPKKTAEADAATDEANDDSSDESDAVSDDEPDQSDGDDEGDATAEEDDASSSSSDTDSAWNSPAEVTSDIVQHSSRVNLRPVPLVDEFSTLHSFRLRLAPHAAIYVRINKGLTSFGGYALQTPFDAVVYAPAYPRELRMMPEGALLSLSGERKLSLVTRGIGAARVEYARLLPNKLEDFIVANAYSSDFSQPDVGGDQAENFAEFFRDMVAINNSDPASAQFTTLDFSQHLAAQKGLFLVNIRGWKTPPRNPERSSDERDSRLVLVTDLGLVMKKHADGSGDVYVASLATGGPVEGANVRVIGKNGRALTTGTTDHDGHVTFETLKAMRREQKPLVVIATKGDDLSFLPYADRGRMLDFSEFDIDGQFLYGEDHLQAYVFSDRGIYRPGETLHAGVVVKSTNWAAPVAGMPLEIVVKDARDLPVHRERTAVPASGLFEFAYTTAPDANTGTYNVSVYLIKSDVASPDANPTAKKKIKRHYLGSTAVRVEDFMPDQMKISTRFSAAPTKGWVHPADLKGTVAVMNLFGTPAADRQVTGSLALSPAVPAFPGYESYSFYNPLKLKTDVKDDLAPLRTGADGNAAFDLHLERFEAATYRLNFSVEAFAAAGGRSVASNSSVLVSPLHTLIGYKLDSEEQFFARNSQHRIQLIAVNESLEPAALQGLTAELIEKKYVSTLLEQKDGTFKYQSVLQELVASQKSMDWAAAGFAYDVPTAAPGDFELRLYDANRVRVAQIPFAVAGEATLSRSLDKTAELHVTLDRDEYEPEGDITLRITAPYTGSGLITIERDRVFTQQWFRLDTNATTQTIHIPKSVEGGAYVNVAVFRARDSQDIFMSPLSFAVVPFTIALTRRTEPISLHVPEHSAPGSAIAVQYHTAYPAKIIVWAVDEGILQFAGYPTPEPFKELFARRALETETDQTLDQIIPEFSLYRKSAAAGGDQSYKFSGNNINPFRRKTDPPIAYWSGVLDSDTTDRTYTIDVPGTFDGRLRVMAFAVDPERIGVTETAVIVRGPFILSPTVPLFVAPGDHFDVNLIAANQIAASGPNAQATIAMSVSDGLTAVGETSQSLVIPESAERSLHFSVQAKTQLGEQRVGVRATLGAAMRQSDTTLSVRPAMPFATRVTAGLAENGEATVALTRAMFPELQSRAVTVSPLPIGLSHALASYITEYPYDCTEQLVSRAFAALLMRAHPEFAAPSAKPAAAFAAAVQQLRTRQRADGSFAYWPSGVHESGDTAAHGNAQFFTSVYATHLLVQAKREGESVPADMLVRAKKYLQGVLGESISDGDAAQLYAYAAYVLTLQGDVTSTYVSNLLQFFDGKGDDWQHSIVAPLLAATYQMLQQSKEAKALLHSYVWQPVAPHPTETFFRSPAVNNALAAFILLEHFPGQFEWLQKNALPGLVQAISDHRFNTLSAAYTMHVLQRAATAMGNVAQQQLHVVTIDAQTKRAPLALQGTLFGAAALPADTTHVALHGDAKRPIFYAVRESGFDRALPTAAGGDGIEISHQLTNLSGTAVDHVTVGEEIMVHVQLRSTDHRPHDNISVADLLPGGFDIADDPGLRQGQSACTVNTQLHPEYTLVRDDRVVLFTTATPDTQEFCYRIRAVSPGEYQVPPAFAASMYDQGTQAHGVGGHITVQAATR